jgi:hypothetical protein
MTRLDNYYKWFKQIEETIIEHRVEVFMNDENVNQGRISQSWIFVFLMNYLFSRTINELKRPDEDKGDQVMGLAYGLSLCLLGWALRCHIAKCCDPRRPLKARKKSFAQWLGYHEVICEFIDPVPTARDKKLFKQEWEPLPWPDV